ncbi:MAG: RluA family pseudouridine synthase [Bdellovibrionales bacterium]|nr:RluA family pseudouridine synthase [Bdellovibrionales bacterium]
MAHSSSLIPPYTILFEDQHLAVLSKSPNLLSQSDISGDPSLVDLLRVHFGRNYVGLVHRLDRNTSGLMVVGKRSKSADRLSAQLISGELERQYHAILLGTFPDQKEQRWEHHLLKNEKTNEVKIVTPSTPGAKSAVLFATPLQSFAHPESGDLVTLTRFRLETGRSHQIRAQALAMNHPLLGDLKYGTSKSRSLFFRTALHSAFLSFLHPMSGEPMKFEERYSFDMIRFFSTSLE